MKSKFKAVLGLGVVLAASGFSMSAEAHCLTQGITQTGTTNALQQDVYMLLCPAATTSIVGKTSLISGGAVTYQIAKGGYTSASVADSTATSTAACTTGTVNGYPQDYITAGQTAQISVAGGAGAYTLVVSKNSTTASNYALEFHCLGSNGVEIQPNNGGVWEQGGPLSNSGIGAIDALDSVTDTNTDVNLAINH